MIVAGLVGICRLSFMTSPAKSIVSILGSVAKRRGVNNGVLINGGDSSAKKKRRKKVGV